MPIFSFSTQKLHIWHLKIRILHSSLDACLSNCLAHDRFGHSSALSLSLRDSFFSLFSSITYFPVSLDPSRHIVVWLSPPGPIIMLCAGKQDGKDGICRHVCRQMSEHVPSLASCTGNISDGKEEIDIHRYDLCRAVRAGKPSVICLVGVSSPTF